MTSIHFLKFYANVVTKINFICLNLLDLVCENLKLKKNEKTYYSVAVNNCFFLCTKR